jgi:hypothetical protein
MLGALALPTFALALGMSVLTTYAPLLLGEATSSAGAIGIAIGAPILLSLPFLAALRREEPELRFDEPAVAALDELALAA